MLANFLIIGFIGVMAYWWGNQGVFSALIHLLCVIVAGALAFALWEPIAVAMLPHIGGSAWGAGLIVPFTLILLLLRVAMDRLIKANVHFSSIFNLTIGGIFGLYAGVLTAGITIIGMGFLDLGGPVGGYQRYIVDAGGRVIEDSSHDLWFGVDRHAAGFYNGLSVGAFSSRQPLKQKRPQVDHMAAIFRMHPDRFASVGVAPSVISIDAWHRANAPLTDTVHDDVVALMGDEARTAGYQLVVVETTWAQGVSGVYDEDGTLRIAPTQIRLLAPPKGRTAQQQVLFAPVGVARGAGETARTYMHLNDPKLFAHGSGQRETFAWAFLLPDDHEPTTLFARNLRLPLSRQPQDDPELIRAAVGSPSADVARPVADRTIDEGDVSERDGIRMGQVATAIELTAALPVEISRNMANPPRVEDDAVISGMGDVRPPAGGRISRALAVGRIAVPSHRAMVRVELERDAARHWLGATRDAAASLHPIFLTDNHNNQWEPVAYVWSRADRVQQISVDFTVPIRNSRQLPVHSMGTGDRLFLYFLVDRNTVIQSYHVGPTVQQVQLTVP